MLYIEIIKKSYILSRLDTLASDTLKITLSENMHTLTQLLIFSHTQMFTV